jgi:hypothetical protein
MANAFLKFKSTENQMVYLRPEAINGFEVVTPSARVEGHIKVFINGFKFLLNIEKDEFLQKLNATASE